MKYRIYDIDSPDDIRMIEATSTSGAFEDFIAERWNPGDRDCYELIAIDENGVMWDGTVDVECTPHFSGYAVRRKR